MHFKVYGGKGGKVLQVSDTDPLENIELLIISDREDRRMLEVLSGAVHLSVDLRCSAARRGSVKSSGFKLNALLL